MSSGTVIALSSAGVALVAAASAGFAYTRARKRAYDEDAVEYGLPRPEANGDTRKAPLLGADKEVYNTSPADRVW